LSHDRECVFCAIARGNAHAHFVYKDERFVAFLDKYPFTKGHALVSPVNHYRTLWEMDYSLVGSLFSLAAKISKAVVKATNTDGFRFVQNNGEAANQVVPHVHIHVIPIKMEERGLFLYRKNFSQDEQLDMARKISELILLNSH
jgi:histidine triad (HIT) family protein